MHQDLTQKRGPLPGKARTGSTVYFALTAWAMAWLSVTGLAVTGGILGCGVVEIPDGVVYPLRSNPLINLEKAPATAPPAFPPPGKPEVSLRWLADQGVAILNPADLDSHEWGKAWRDEVNTFLMGQFGTPAKPRVGNEGSAAAAIGKLSASLNLAPAVLERGSKQYRRLCLHCHGLGGEGAGATSGWLNPLPRDFRQGEFKFISTAEHKLETGNQPLKARPRRVDILRTLHQGLDGTSMPSFALLAEEDIQALASYTLHLSIRGEVEYWALYYALRQDAETIKAIEKDPKKEAQARTARFLAGALEWEDPEADVEDFVAKTKDKLLTAGMEKLLDRLLREYAAADNNPIQPMADPYGDAPTTSKSIANCLKIFQVQCVNCHAGYGRQSALRFDNWGGVVRPANLTTPVYKGGRRPVDLYYRIFRGIPPCGMPKANLQDGDPARQAWDLVRFLLAIPYPETLPPEIRQQIHGGAKQ